MAEELGKIERPDVTEFKKGRKLFFVPLVMSIGEGDLDLAMRIGKYWDQVDSQLTHLENRLGRVTCIFYEMVTAGGEEGLKTIETMCRDSLRITRSRIDMGARLQPLEDAELLFEYLDWGRCLNLGLQSQSVFNHVYEAYKKAQTNRNETIARRIDENLGNDESGILIMQEGHGVQFPPDIQVIYVSPPALDELKRWLRDREEKREKEQEKTDGITERK